MSRTPISIEALLEKKKKEEEAASKVFLLCLDTILRNY
jgi:hypothetical protein